MAVARDFAAMVMDHTGHSAEALEEAFAMVRPASHWKDPIDSLIPKADIEVVKVAIEFYTATEAVFSPVPGSPAVVRVEADGYRRGPAGDH